MRILIDECLDWRLCRDLENHDCVSVRDRGWTGLKNGVLLDLAQNEFDVFITGDRNLSSQQSILQFNIAVVVLKPKSTRLNDTRLLMPTVLSILTSIVAGQLVTVAE